jgi:metallo-beta-lactamase family protein
LGRHIVEEEKTVRIYGEEYQVRAKIEVLAGFSGHADRDGLIAFVRHMRCKPQYTFIVHGEEESSESLANPLSNELDLENVVTPEPLQTFDV